MGTILSWLGIMIGQNGITKTPGINMTAVKQLMQMSSALQIFVLFHM